MRFVLGGLLCGALLVAPACTSRGPAPASRQGAPLQSGDAFARACARAGVEPGRAQRMQTLPDRLVFGVLLPSVRAESDARPSYRILAYAPATDALAELLPEAEWASLSGGDLLAVERGALRLHRQGAVKTLLEHAAPDFAVDPTGRWLAAVVPSPALPLETVIVLLPEEGGPSRALPHAAGHADSRPVFTPDDRAVVFVSGRSGRAALWRAELAGGAPARLTGDDVPPPPDRAALRWEGEALVYEAQGRAVRVAGGGR